MTEAEAISRLKDHFRIHDDGRPTPKLDEAVDVAIKALETMQKLKERNMAMEVLENYMQFEDECVKKGFTFKSLLEAREKQIPKKPVGLQKNICPNCSWHIVGRNQQYCSDCGQKLDWSEV